MKLKSRRLSSKRVGILSTLILVLALTMQPLSPLLGVAYAVDSVIDVPEYHSTDVGDNKVRVTWRPVTTTKNNRYEIRLASSESALDSAVVIPTGQYPYKDIKRSDIDGGGKWFWQVRASNVIDGVRQYSNWSSPRSFYLAPLVNKPKYHSPSNGAAILNSADNVKLVWYRPVGTYNNRYEVRWASSMEVLESAEIRASENSGMALHKYIPMAQLGLGDWFWQVRAMKDGVYSGWTTPRSFTINADNEPINSNPHTTIVAPTGVVGSKFTVSGLATDDEALNRVYIQLVHRGTSQRHGGTSINLIGKGTEAEWSREFDAKALNLPDGQYAAHAQAVDMNGNRYDTGWTVNFTVDTTRPTIELISPTATDFNPSEMSASATDAAGLSAVTLDLYDAANSSLIKGCSRPASGATSLTATCPVPADLADGTYTIRYNARDLAGNLSQTKTHKFVVDNTAPTITVKDDFVGDKGAKIFSKVSFQLFDANMADKYSLNGTVRDFTNNRWSDANYDNIKGLLVQGENELVLYDVAGNTASYKFTYDPIAPTASISVSNESPKVGESVTVTGSVANEDNIKSHWFEIRRPDRSMFYKSNMNTRDNSFSFEIDNLDQAGVYRIRYVATDRAGNRNDDPNYTNSTIFYLNVDEAPAVEPEDPSGPVTPVDDLGNSDDQNGNTPEGSSGNHDSQPSRTSTVVPTSPVVTNPVAVLSGLGFGFAPVTDVAQPEDEEESVLADEDNRLESERGSVLNETDNAMESADKEDSFDFMKFLGDWWWLILLGVLTLGLFWWFIAWRRRKDEEDQ